MRFILPVFFVILLTVPSFAAPKDAGSFEVTAGNILGYRWISDPKRDDKVNHQFYIGLTDLTFGLGYFPINNISFGGCFYYHYSIDNHDYSSDDKNKELMINPYFKFYIPISDNLYYYCSGNTAFYWAKSGYSKNYSISPYYRFGLGIETGLTVMIMDTLGLHVSFCYGYFFNVRQNGHTLDDTACNSIMLTCGLTAYFGGTSSGSGSTDENMGRIFDEGLKHNTEKESTENPDNNQNKTPETTPAENPAPAPETDAGNNSAR